MRTGSFSVRPAGGAKGCLLMLVVSVVASVALTLLVNLALR